MTLLAAQAHDTSDLLAALAVIVLLGTSAQWLAWRLKIPSILLLLLFGIMAGPARGIINPQDLFGDLLLPFVSVSVAMILYEGGLSLRSAEWPTVGHVVRNLVILGALVTWAIGAIAAYFILGLNAKLAALLGAVLIVTGPTVIGPLLAHIRPSASVGAILRWEGIVIDPVGAMLAVLVFEVIVAAESGEATLGVAAAVLLKTVLFGGGLGFLSAALLTLLLWRHWIPETLQNAVSVTLVVATFALANHVQDESGLLAVTVMGMVLANQRFADVAHIVEFKENVRVLLIAVLFIVLAARLETLQLTSVLVPGLVFTAVLILVARPLSVLVSTLRSRLSWRECTFLAWVAPRGIVAAAVSSVFALRLRGLGEGFEEARVLVPVTFIVIIVTVAVYGLSSPWAARRLRVADPNPQGVLLVGAHPWARAWALVLQNKGVRVMVVDTNRDQAAAARMAGLPTYSGSIMAEYAVDNMDLSGIGRLVAATPNDWVNALAVQRFRRLFGQNACYQLPPTEESERKKGSHRHLHGRLLFGNGRDSTMLNRMFAQGARVKVNKLSDTFNLTSFQMMYGESAVPLCVLDDEGKLTLGTVDKPLDPKPGQTLVSLVFEPKEVEPKPAGG